MASKINTLFCEPSLQLYQNPNFVELPNLEDVRIEPDLSNFSMLVDDIRKTEQRKVPDIPLPKTFDQLMKALREASDNLPEEYQSKFALPLIRHLQKRFNEGIKAGRGHLPFQLSEIEHDAITATLLNGNRCPRTLNTTREIFCQATKAIQELVSDLYDGFVIEQGTRFPRSRATPSLHLWKNIAGPYTYDISALEQIGLKATLVAMPIVNSTGGLLAWTTYAHEVAGHNNLHAGICLWGELQNTIYQRLLQANVIPSLARYWAERTDEVVSDILGILTLGPAAAIGLIGYFRGLSPTGKLRANGEASDPHPSDLLRGFLAAKVVQQLNISNAREWAQVIERETVKDYPLHRIDQRTSFYAPVALANQLYSFRQLLKSVEVVVKSVLYTQLQCMGKRSLFELRAWDDNDMAQTQHMINHIEGKIDDCELYSASHVVAAATFSALKSNADISRIFRRMTALLSKMHRYNPHWVVAG